MPKLVLLQLLTLLTLANGSPSWIVQTRKQLRQTMHGTFVDVDMQVADMKHCEAVEPAWQCLECKIAMVDPDPLRVSYATPIQAGQLQRCSNDGMDRVPVLDVEKIDALAKNLSLMISFDSQTLTRVQLPKALLELAENRLVHNLIHKGF